MSYTSNIALAIHGGAGTITRSQMTPEKEAAYTEGLQTALRAGWKMLQNKSTAVEAVEVAVRELEDNPLFNAGRGSVFTHDARHEMDACIMSGADLSAGAVTCVSNIKNPIVLARKVMTESEHVLLCGAGAEAFARETDCAFADDAYFFDAFRFNQLQQARHSDTVQLDHALNNSMNVKKFGTVGAVALDIDGNLAAATSTGGMTNKRFGRIGDSPIIGAGTYADNRTCAVSCTGHGEMFMRAVAAYDVACLMKYKGLNLQAACEQVIGHELKNLNGEGGLIAVDAAGNICLTFNSEGMYRASVSSNDALRIMIYRD